MKTGEFYYLMMVCGAFAIFGVMLALNYLSYRGWLKHHPTQND